MNIKIRFIFRTNIGKKVRLVDETFECLDDNFSINIDNENINDFSKAIDSKFTKTLKLAGTERAVAFFKEYYEVRYEGENDFSFIFNSRTGEHCIIYVDDVEVMQGVALLTGITRNKNLTIFEIQVINDVKGILNEFKNLYIDELDEFNYEWTFENVRELLHTIKGDIFTGICMADGECVSQKFISSENAIRTAIDMSKIPIAGNVKKLIDKAFEKIGVEYQSEFFSNNQVFSDLWLCNNKEKNLGIWGDDDKMLLDFRYDDLKITDYCLFKLSDYTYNFDNNDFKVYINKFDRNISYNNILHDYSYYGNLRYNLQGGLTVDIAEADEFDSYVNGDTQHIYLAGGCKYNINLNLQNYQMTSHATNNLWRAHIIFKFTDLATGEVEKLNYYSDFVNYNAGINLNPSFEKELEHNTMLDIYIQEDIALHPDWEATSEKYFAVEKNPFYVNIKIRKIAGSHVRLQGSDINLYSQLPHINVYELIVNLQKMFNLVFSLDKDTEKLIIEPEIDYYKLNEANLIDITDLVDYSQDIVIEPASTLIDYNKISAKYNISDKDFHNSYCQSQYGRAFGEFKTEFESYTKGELAIKNEFTICKAATYIYNDYYVFTASYENENGNLKKVSADKAFIGVRKVHIDTHAKTIKLWYNENIYENYNSAQYNILDFCSADFDYCYDTPRVVFSSMANLPLDNLFYTYYFKVLQEYIQLSGKIVRLKCYFDPITFSTLSKKRVVYWENNYWKLLKVSDWSPLKPVVDVTLLKMIDVEVPSIQPKPHIPDVQWFLGGFVRPAQVDVDNLSVTMLDTLSKTGALISNKAGSVNLNEIADTVRYLTDGIAKYDKYDFAIVECFLEDNTEIAFPDYTNFDGLRAWPVVEIKNTVFQNIRFTGDFKMNNLEVVNYMEFFNSIFDGIFSCEKVKYVGNQAFENSVFNGDFNCPNLQEVGDGAFELSIFNGIFNCPNLQAVGQYAFRNSNFTGDFNCPNLTQIYDHTFTNSLFTGEFNCPNLTYVGSYAFTNSQFTGEFECPNLSDVGYYTFTNSLFTGEFNCPNLQAVGEGAFLYSVFNGSFNCPNLTTVGSNAFLNSQFDGEFNCPNLQAVGQYAFGNSDFTGEFNCPKLQAVGEGAFENSTFDTITIGANATLETGCIGTHSAEFIQDYADNGKLAGTYVWDGSHWIYQG